ncbi:MAG: DUF389 domain-containing protein [Candidatus Sericytochromatia bacterium]|nr:DUF389 domain-containing protein [Candidatus Sericytochromatia bacterium]
MVCPVLLADLKAESTVSPEFVLLACSSAVIATFGLLANSPAVIIGAMIVAPMMMPIRGLAYAALRGDVALFRRALSTIVLSAAGPIAIAAVLGILVGYPEPSPEATARTQPTLLDLGIALAAGVVSGAAKLRPRIGDAVAGTAIAVALVPPLCVVGLLLALGRWAGAWGATLLFLTNLLGVSVACMAVFAIGGLATFGANSRRTLQQAAALITLLTVPLAYGSRTVLEKARLQASVRDVLTRRTITLSRLDLVAVKLELGDERPLLRLSVRTVEPPTPRQVALVEAFLARELHRPYRVVFEVSQEVEVWAPAEAPASPDARSPATASPSAAPPRNR